MAEFTPFNNTRQIYLQERLNIPDTLSDSIAICIKRCLKTDDLNMFVKKHPLKKAGGQPTLELLNYQFPMN